VERTFTYRNGYLFFVALWFSVLGLVFSLVALRASFSGNQMVMMTRDGTILSTGPLAWVPVFLPALAVPFGLWLFLFAANSKVVLDTDGVRITNWSNRTVFKAAWDEITAVHGDADARGGYSIAIETANHKELITSSLVGIKDLEKTLKDHILHSNAA
jgi:hypothetical protein